ncbi:hypothetical protein HMPREF2946_07365 [Actinomyces sp. HMSC062G12]|nr:hypothetical protein HMPREF2946_07365 [Actinomyces sp. HMSC062G12]
MTAFAPFKDLDGVATYQERVVVQAVRLTRENGEELAKRARKHFGFTQDGRVILTDQIGVLWAIEGDMLIATPGTMRVSWRITEDFLAGYTHPGQEITEEDLA